MPFELELMGRHGVQLQGWRQTGDGQIEILLSTYGDYPETVSIVLTKDQAKQLGEWLLREA